MNCKRYYEMDSERAHSLNIHHFSKSNLKQSSNSRERIVRFYCWTKWATSHLTDRKGERKMKEKQRNDYFGSGSEMKNVPNIYEQKTKRLKSMITAQKCRVIK